MNDRKFVIINCSYETYTPGHSGAICTWIRAICAEAERDGIRPELITRSSQHPQYERAGAIFLDYPNLPKNRLLAKAYGAEKRLRGWVRPRQGKYCDMVFKAVESLGGQRGTLMLNNDMELAVELRRVFPHATIAHLAQNLNGSTPRYQKTFAKSVNAAMAVSDFCARWNEGFYGFAPGQVKTLYNGVDTSAFRPAKSREQKPVINFVGKLDPIKGPDIVLKAALKLSQKTTNFSVQIVGRKYYSDDVVDNYVRGLYQLGEQLGKLGVECKFVGWVDRNRIADVLAPAHIGVTPSRWDEPFGLTTLEMMACGLATIGSNTGGTPEVIGPDGFVFERDNHEQLAGILEQLVSDPAHRESYGVRARARAETFSWANTWKSLKSAVGLTS